MTAGVTGVAVLTLEQARPTIMHEHPLDVLPSGVRVIVNVGEAWVQRDVADFLHGHARRLSVDIHGHPRVVGAWISAVRDPSAFDAEFAERMRSAWGVA